MCQKENEEQGKAKGVMEMTIILSQQRKKKSVAKRKARKVAKHKKENL